MNQLILLEDRVGISTERCGLVIVKRDFPFRELKVDLGFKHRLADYKTGDYHDGHFYSIPILDFLNLGNESPAEVQKQILEQCAAHASIRLGQGVVGTQRFLIRYAGGTELKLAEVSPPEYQGQVKGRLAESKGYWHGDSHQLTRRIPDFVYSLQKAEQELEAIERLNQDYREGV